MTWKWQSRRNGYRRTGELWLYWEAHGDPISDNYTPEEMPAAALWSMWVTDCKAQEGFDGWVGISWFVEGDGTCEGVPFVPCDWSDEHFLTFFTWPEDTVTGAPVNWLTLPVVDKLWNPRQSDKGGFIQEHTGWKPGPLQDRLWLPALEACARAPGRQRADTATNAKGRLGSTAYTGQGLRRS